jgi:Co/Zn/Cd efflux system component
MRVNFRLGEQKNPKKHHHHHHHHHHHQQQQQQQQQTKTKKLVSLASVFPLSLIFLLIIPSCFLI